MSNINALPMMWYETEKAVIHTAKEAVASYGCTPYNPNTCLVYEQAVK